MCPPAQGIRALEVPPWLCVTSKKAASKQPVRAAQAGSGVSDATENSWLWPLAFPSPFLCLWLLQTGALPPHPPVKPCAWQHGVGKPTPDEAAFLLPGPEPFDKSCPP